MAKGSCLGVPGAKAKDSCVCAAAVPWRGWLVGGEKASGEASIVGDLWKGSSFQRWKGEDPAPPGLCRGLRMDGERAATHTHKPFAG